MQAIDNLELDVLEHTGNIDQAETAGAIARWCCEQVAAAVATICGLNPETLVIDFEVLAGRHPAQGE